MDLWNRVKQGKPLAAESFRLLLNNMPFANLAYVRLALNYMFLWQVQEALNPGFIQRWQERVQQDQHAKFWLSPAAAVGH